MASLKEFLKKSDEPQSPGSPFPVAQRAGLTKSMSSGISLATTLHMPSDKVGAFSQQVSELATSDDVINELSDALGAPKPNETEDEFVARAKATMTRILKQKLSK
ncbi:MAG TPA: hypothetical protein VIO59_14655 [Rhodanobacter sp.]